jgi:class 3 adenylate cyclase
MIERERIEDVISKVEAQRAALGDVVVDTTVDSLRRQLLALQPQSPLRQRKQVTVLFADLSGYTAMAATRDAEEVCDTMDTLWRRLDSIVTAWGGHVDKHMGDGMMALFGVPVAHEDDPERAVAAALAMQAALRALNGRIGLGMRIGISTGRVLLGPVGHSAEVTAVGDAVNVAGFLEQHAPVGRVLISHDVYRHVGGAFLLEPAGPLGMEGKVEPVQTYVVKQSRSRSRRTPGRGVEGVETHMIGRDVELRQLQTALQQVQYGNPGQMVTILGEAGIGKSRLRHEFKQYLHKPARPVALLEARADRSMRRLPYALIRDLLAGISGL